MKFETQTGSDSGVSPVVGVILMVAITVILSAIIATFVLDLGGSVNQNPQAGVTFDEDNSANEITVQAVSMENADSLTVKQGGSSVGTISSVGGSVTYTGTDGGSGTITVTGTLDGKTSVIQTYDYNNL